MANIFQIDISHLHSSDVSHIGSYHSNNDNQGTLSSIDLVVEHSTGEIHSDSSTISIFTNDINMKN